MIVWRMFAGDLLIFVQPLENFYVTVRMPLITQMHLTLVGGLILIMIAIRVVYGLSPKHSDT